MTIIGDVHGKFNEYKIKTTYHDETIQLGDFGFKDTHDKFLKEIYTEENNHLILFGNHDYYPYLDKEYSLGDYIYMLKDDIFCIRGAESIDKKYRTLGIDWFPDEEISYGKWPPIIEAFKKAKPKIVVTHDCPEIVRVEFFGITNKSLTSSGLQRCLEEHHPEKWIFGHHHYSIQEKITGYSTEFICLKELETYIIK